MRFPPLQLLALLLTLWGINLNGLTGNQVSLPSWGTTAPTVNPGTPSSSIYDAKDLFYLQLYRDQRPNTNDGASAPAARINGDISFVATQVRGRDQMLFGIKYDEYDRMRDARFYERSSATATAIYASHYWETAAYDERGNITDLNRRGTYVNNNLYYEQGFDDLDYTYQANSNRLHSIDDATSNARGYHEQPGTYDYDDNGNTTYDPSRKIIIAYNHLDLPTSIRWLSSGQQRIELTYDAAGTMLTRKRINSSGTTEEIRDYIGGIEYVDNALESVHHAEGRVYFGVNGTERYDYALTDHLGNTRLLYSDLNNNGVPEVPNEIIQEEHYYPFGMKMTGPWMGAAAGATTAYQYNGIEHVDDFDLNVNMAMYRTLDPVIGRWWSVDPKAGGYYGFSPYNGMGNSPMNFADPAGDEPIAIAAILIGMAIGAGTHTASHLIQNNFTFQNWNWGAFVGSTVAGGVGAVLGPVLEAARIGGFAGGAMLGGAMGLSSSLVSNIINPGFSINSIASSTISGVFIGGLVGGLSTGKGYSFWDGRSNFPVQRYQLADGINPITEDSANKVSGSPTMSLEEAISRGEVGPMGNGSFIGRLGTANPDVRNINAGFEGKLRVKGNAFPVEGTEFYLNIDGKDIISTKTSLKVDMKISTSSKNISWGIRGSPIIQPTTQGSIGFQVTVRSNSYLYITGKHRGWNGFLLWDN